MTRAAGAVVLLAAGHILAPAPLLAQGQQCVIPRET